MSNRYRANNWRYIYIYIFFFSFPDITYYVQFIIKYYSVIFIAINNNNNKIERIK